MNYPKVFGVETAAIYENGLSITLVANSRQGIHTYAPMTAADWNAKALAPLIRRWYHAGSYIRPIMATVASNLCQCNGILMVLWNSGKAAVSVREDSRLLNHDFCPYA
jgi:hypothetical protein